MNYTPLMMRGQKVAIIGGGVCGLGIGWRLPWTNVYTSWRRLCTDSCGHRRIYCWYFPIRNCERQNTSLATAQMEGFYKSTPEVYKKKTFQMEGLFYYQYFKLSVKNTFIGELY